MGTSLLYGIIQAIRHMIVTMKSMWLLYEKWKCQLLFIRKTGIMKEAAAWLCCCMIPWMPIQHRG